MHLGTLNLAFGEDSMNKASTHVDTAHIHPALKRIPLFEGFGARHRPLDSGELAAVVSELARRPDLWQTIVRHDPAQRWYRSLLASTALEVWLIGWAPGQATRIHDHGGALGALAVTAGELVEEVYASPDHPRPRGVTRGW